MVKAFHYGGQAVIEGVMIRGQRNMAIAVRRPNGEPALTIEPLGGLYHGRLRVFPLLRGIVVLVETMVLGVRALLYSAQVSLNEEGEEISSTMVWGMISGALIFAIAFFFLVPVFLVHLTDPFLHSPLISNIVEGVIRLALFALYLWGVGLIPDIGRVFAYHGAEHKAVNAYEDGAAMNIEAVRSYNTAHSRCGTGFLLIVLVIAVVIFALLGQPPLWLRLVSRVALIPAIAALGYEVMRFGADHNGNRVVRAIFAPSLALQVMTTREPDEGQLEIAISALKSVLDADGVST